MKSEAAGDWEVVSTQYSQSAPTVICMAAVPGIFVTVYRFFPDTRGLLFMLLAKRCLLPEQHPTTDNPMKNFQGIFSSRSSSWNTPSPLHPIWRVAWGVYSAPPFTQADLPPQSIATLLIDQSNVINTLLSQLHKALGNLETANSRIERLTLRTALFGENIFLKVSSSPSRHTRPWGNVG